jgi:hypothetical protein
MLKDESERGTDDELAPISGVEVYRQGQEERRQSLKRRGIDGHEAMLEALLTSSNTEHLLLILEVIDRSRLDRSLLPRLRELCLHRTGDLPYLALNLMLEMVERDQAAQVLRSLARDPDCRVQGAVAHHLSRIGYKEDVPVVATHVLETLRRRRSTGMHGSWWELCDWCAFLDEFVESEPVVRELYEWMRKRWRRSGVDEYVERRQPFFGHHSGRTWVLMVRDDRIGGTRLVNKFFQILTGAGLSLLEVDNPRFESAFGTFAGEADVIITIGEAARARVDRCWRGGLAPVAHYPTPGYEDLDDHELKWPLIHMRDFLAAAEREEAGYLERFRELLDQTLVRHTRPMWERMAYAG